MDPRVEAGRGHPPERTRAVHPLRRNPIQLPSLRAPGARAATIAYVVSRFPKLTETFVLYEMEAVEREGARIELYPLQLERGTRMHPEAARWVARAQFTPLLSWPIVRAHLGFMTRNPLRYGATLLGLMRATWGSPRYFVGGLAFFPKAGYLARRMLDAGVDHVHAHFASHPAAVAWVIHRLAGIPYSFTAHGSDLHRDQHMLGEKVAAAAFVVTISNYNRDVIQQACGSAASSKVHVIHCGVDTEVFRPARGATPARPAARPFTLLCVGTLHEVKGQSYLVEACRQLAGRGVPFACELVGDGPDQGKLAQQALEAGIADRVRFRGQLTREEVREAVQEADVVVAPSVPTANGRREGIPVALMEAMASARPVIASRLSGIPELVEDGESGLLVEPRDAAGIARAIERLLGDEPLRRRLGEAGRVKVEREFDLHQSAAILAERFSREAKR